MNEIPHLRINFRTIVYLRSRSHSQEMKQGDGERPLLICFKDPSWLSLLVPTHGRHSHLMPLSAGGFYPFGNISNLTILHRISVSCVLLLFCLVFILKRKSVSFGLF